MTPAQKKVISLLLLGHFLIWSRQRRCYTLYDQKMNPIVRMREGTVTGIDRFIDPKMKLWKVDKRGRMTLNLNTVRRLHGRSTIKKLYKKAIQLDSSGTIYKPKARKRKTVTNEKVHYLF